jgi:hypothetical protein
MLFEPSDSEELQYRRELVEDAGNCRLGVMAMEGTGDDGNCHVGRMPNTGAEYDELSEGCEGAGFVVERLSLACSYIGRVSIKFQLA